MADLLFDSLPASNGDLVFGDTPDWAPPPIEVTAALVLGGPSLDVHITIPYPVTVSLTLAGPTVSIKPVYISGAQRPTTAETVSAWQAGAAHETGADLSHDPGLPTPAQAALPWQAAAPLAEDVGLRHQEGAHVSRPKTTRFQRGVRAGAGSLLRHQEGVISRTSRATAWQEADDLRPDDLSVAYQEAIRTRRNRTAARWQQATRHTGVTYTGRVGDGLPLEHNNNVRYQEAWPPRPGRWIKPTPPVPSPCYTPSGHLVFSQAWDGSADLVFVCENHGTPLVPATVVVPVRRVYVQLNTASLRRVTGDIAIPTFTMSISLDVDSWTWSFSANVPMQAQDTVLSDEPIEVEALINDTPYRFIIERVSRSRQFGSMPSLRLTGRGKSALLDKPYAPVLSFSNEASARTAQQLMGDVLTLNGVPIGWDVDWNIDDWNVPAGVFVKQGTYIEALNAIANSVGAYIQPADVAQELRVLHRYPVVPWEWATVTPDFELPAAVTTQEGIEWMKRPVYDRVFVSGVSEGVLGQYTRTGTAGDLIAPTITDPLITAAAAARQRGRVAVAQSGNSANVTLRLPVLEETGVIKPGSWVRYVDGSEIKFGLTRSVSVDVGLPEVWQTLQVETRALS